MFNIPGIRRHIKFTSYVKSVLSTPPPLEGNDHLFILEPSPQCNLQTAQISLLSVKIYSFHLYCLVKAGILYLQKVLIIENSILGKIIPKQIF